MVWFSVGQWSCFCRFWFYSCFNCCSLISEISYCFFSYIRRMLFFTFLLYMKLLTFTNKFRSTCFSHAFYTWNSTLLPLSLSNLSWFFVYNPAFGIQTKLKTNITSRNSVQNNFWFQLQPFLTDCHDTYENVQSPLALKNTRFGALLPR